MARLDDKVAIITGAASGLGRSMAELFAAEGAKVLIADVDDAAGAEVADAIAAAGGTARFEHLDVASEADWATGVEVCGAELGAPDVLVSNALLWLPATIADVTTDDW